MQITDSDLTSAKKIILVDEDGKDLFTGIQIIRDIEETRKIIVVKSDGISI